MATRLWGIGVITAGLLACSVEGDSGLNRVQRMGDLDGDGLVQFCEWQIDELGGEGTAYDCGGGSEYAVGTVDECVSGQGCYEGCDLTVGENEDCTAAIADDPCSGGDARCQPVIECFLACLGG